MKPHQAALALSAADVERIHREKKVAVIVGFLNAASLGTDLSLIDTYYRAGIRTFGFVHAGNNDFADSSRPIGDDKYGEHGGLSLLGREAVTRLNRLGVIIDVSQLTPEALLQSVKLSKAPVVATHSAIKALVDSSRNLSDIELDAIKANGGVVQIVAFSYYLKAPRFDLASKYKELAARYKKDTRELSKEEAAPSGLRRGPDRQVMGWQFSAGLPPSRKRLGAGSPGRFTTALIVLKSTLRDGPPVGFPCVVRNWNEV